MSRIQVVAGIIVKNTAGNERQVLLAKRNAKQHQGGLWEFPGGKVDTNEDHFSALQRELQEELGITIQNSQFFQEIKFDYSDKQVALNFYLISEYTGNEHGAEGQPLEWVRLSELKNYSFPEANQAIVDRLACGDFAG
ncbi:MAG: 8-oxo-dGTP diphosphatase MutT [Kangiellaceae bacterium]